jgi:hypothetical protein
LFGVDQLTVAGIAGDDTTEAHYAFPDTKAMGAD